MWVPVHDEEWDGDIPLSLNRPNRPDNDSEDGEVVFQRGTLPWQTGRYEVRPPCISTRWRDRVNCVKRSGTTMTASIT